ncbi:hypothetical protein SLEP1_g57231 [Rubroshorea leprosula]|uniref:Separase-like TPR repeats region domain-containing protein n=1 Tax=Rubroshorea leprosula TaxID=152421 RepID=A0AAV5MKL7_9ROSI|nr:hypothetical protein SLEP1_g57231 [Rubroshorea leprosula]
MASSSEFSSILSILESSDDPNRIHTLVSDYLRPFANLLNPKKPSKKRDRSEASAVRSLAKQFLNFINKSLSILPRRLSKQNPDGAALFPLFETYRLCLDCLELVSSQLACGAHEVQSQRVRLLYCLEAWGKYAEAESEGFRVLERLRRGRDLEGKLPPRADSRGGPGNADFGKVLVDAVANIVRCVAMRQSKDSADYWRVLDLVVKVRPWFRYGELLVCLVWMNGNTHWSVQLFNNISCSRSKFNPGCCYLVFNPGGLIHARVYCHDIWTKRWYLSVLS